MILLVVCVKIKLAVYKLRSLNVRVLRVTILLGQSLWAPGAGAGAGLSACQGAGAQLGWGRING